MNRAIPRGLFAADDTAVPLEGVRIDAHLRGAATEVTVTQRYVNREAVPIEAVYVFPLEEGAAVSGFAARIGERLVEGRIEERDAAFAAYDDAMADGHGAFLLDQERPNVFTASVGNLRPGEQVDLELRYVALAPREGAALRFMIPTTVSPRYVPASGPEIGQPDGERVNPERRFEVPYGLTLTVALETASPIVAIDSPSHPVRTQLTPHGATVALSSPDAALDRDFVLLVETAAGFGAEALAAQEPDGTRVAMVAFAPDPAATPATGHEVLFLLDCSGSMGGDSITQARRALELCVRALAPEDTFNVTRFGSHHVSLWPSPRPLTDATLDEAVAWVRAAEADLGGTEVLAPLSALLAPPPTTARARQVLLLTDGEVSNEAEVIALAAAHAAHARVFTFGIGAGASEHLVRGVARASRGAAEFIFPGERIEAKVLRAFNRVRTPSFADVRVDWGGLAVEQAPRAVPPAFAGEQVVVFARLHGTGPLTATLHAGERRWSLPVDLDAAPIGGPIPTLWARHALRDLEEAPQRGSSQRRPGSEDRQRDAILALGRRYGLMSSQTSFVAVEVRPEGAQTTTTAALRRVPVALTAGWGGHGALLRGRGPVARPIAMAAAPLGAPPPAPAPASPGFMAKRKGAAPPATQRRARISLEPTPERSAPSGGARFDAMEREESFAMDAAPAYEARAVAPSPMSLASPRAVYGEAADRLFALLATQRADGHFTASAELRQWIAAATALAAFDAAVAAHGEGVVATAVALALFARDAADRELEWRPAAQKARRWLDAQGSAFMAKEVLG